MTLITRILNKVRDMEPSEIITLKKELLHSLSEQLTVQYKSPAPSFLDLSVASLWRLLEPAQIDEEILKKAMQLLDHPLMKKGRGD